MDVIINSMDMSLIISWEIVKDREAWRAAVHGIAKSWIRLSDEQHNICHICMVQFSSVASDSL